MSQKFEERIKAYWKEFEKEFEPSKDDIDRLNDAIEKWKTIKNNISNNGIEWAVKKPQKQKNETDDVFNKYDKEYKDSLMFFINYASPIILGTGQNGYSFGYLKDRDKYYKNKNSEIKGEDLKIQKENIRKVISDFLNNCNEENSEKFENSGILGDFIRRKIIMLESLSSDKDIAFSLPLIKDIDDLYDLFTEDSKEDRNRGNWVAKGCHIMDCCYKWLGIDAKNPNSVYKISNFLWEIKPFAKGWINEEAPNVIFYGAPGTGKTYNVLKMLSFLGASERSKMIQCHPGFGYEEFIEGLKPVGFTDNGIKFEVVNGCFKDLCIEAWNHPEDDYYFIADEINRANLSSMFGETLSLLEPDYRVNPSEPDKANMRNTPLSRLISEQMGKETKKKQVWVDDHNMPFFGIPKNVRFVGMMNDVDKSIDTFDLALRRRFKWIRMDCDYDVIIKVLIKNGYDNDSLGGYVDGCKRLNSYISSNKSGGLGFGKSYEFGHSYFLKIKSITNKKITAAKMKELFNCNMEPVLREYIRSFKDEEEIDSIIDKARNIFVKGSNEVENENE